VRIIGEGMLQFCSFSDLTAIQWAQPPAEVFSRVDGILLLFATQPLQQVDVKAATVFGEGGTQALTVLSTG